MNSREIGGYLEYEINRGKALHEEAYALNSCRSALELLIKIAKIREIALPIFLGSSVSDICKRNNVSITWYAIDETFRPLNPALSPDTWLLVVNYYGQIHESCIKEYQEQVSGIIVDNTQSYFAEPIIGVHTIYSCRKYFGVSDGGWLYTDIDLKDLYRKLETDTSFDHMQYLLGRFECNASEFYKEFKANENRIAKSSILKMSRITKNVLRGIDYEFVENRRTENFQYLHSRLGGRNKLAHLKIPQGAFAYPLWLEDGDAVRKKLIEEKIYIPVLWPNVVEETEESSLEHNLAINILPLPCDQRYDIDDMERICEVIGK